MAYIQSMNNDQLFTKITTLVNEITADETALEQKRQELRGLTRKWAGNETEAEAPKPARAKRVTGNPNLNISHTVRAFVQRKTGQTVPEIMDALGLRAHEAAVRSALKKENGKTLASVKGQWYPIPQDAAETEEKAHVDRMHDLRSPTWPTPVHQ